MDETLQHDPKAKFQIKNALFDFLYSPVQKKLAKKLEQIAIKNAVLGKYSHASFAYKDEFYCCDTNPPPRKMNRLLLQMQGPMNEYLAEQKELNENELPYVLGFINQVLNSSNELHDYLRVFPEATHHPIQQLINTCPCRTKSLTDESIDSLKQNNKEAIRLLCQRMLINMII